MKSSAAEYFRTLSPLKGGTLYEKDDHSGKSGRCHCCPYGYHIDLDFVRYCQALNQGAKNDNPTLVELKKMKKARRRQTKSMEAMLGIVGEPHEDKAWFKDQNYNSYGINQELKTCYELGSPSGPVPPPRERKKFFSPPSPPPRKQSLTHPALRSPPPPDIINSPNLLLHKRNEAASDALHEAVMDFEEILQSSKEHPRRKSRLDGQHQPYSTIDLLHHTPTYTSNAFFFPKGIGIKSSGATVTRSNSLPRQWKVKDFLDTKYSNHENDSISTSRNSKSKLSLPLERESDVLHDSNSFSRQPYYNSKEPLGMSQSYHYSTSNGYSGQSPLISDAMSALNAAQGFSVNRTQDFDTMSVTSAMSGVSTTTLQSIRDQMATGLSRLKDLEEEVKGLPSLQVKLDILKEEKRILLQQLRWFQRGQEPPSIPFSIEREVNESNLSDLEYRLENLKKFSLDKERARMERKRSLSPMRVNLQDFHSYRRARRGSHSEGSDTESVHSCKARDKNGENDDTRLFISEWNDHRSYEGTKKNSCSLPGTPMTSRKGCKDAAVSCRVLTRDVGVSYVAPRSRSIGTLTDRIEDINKDADKKREVKAKPCLQCFRRNQKTFESRSVGTTSPKHDSGHLSASSLSNESLGPDELEAKLQELDTNSKNILLHKLGKKSPIISRLSSPQLFPPTLTFDNSTNTEPIHQKDQRLNTFLRMDDLFSREELNELVEDAKKQWEATSRSRFLPKMQSKPITSDRGTQTLSEESLRTRKPLVSNIGVSVKPSTRDVGIGYSSINVPEKKVSVPKMRSVACGEDTPYVEKKPSLPRTRSIACGEDTPVVDKKISAPKVRSVICGGDIPIPGRLKSVGVGDHRIEEECPECRKRKLGYHVRNVGCGDDRISDILCDKCKHRHVKTVGVGDSRITDEICDKCRYKRTSNFSCQVSPLTRSESVQVSIPTPSRETSVATTPEVERRPFGSPGVKICDKCHEAITSVAKDFVGISGPSSSTPVINQPTSKIPRLVDYHKPEEKSPPKPLIETTPLPPKTQPLELPLKKEEPTVETKTTLETIQSSTILSLKPEKPASSFKSEEKVVSKTKTETVSSSSSIVSSSIPSSLPSITSSPQVKRIPYNRQETYTKLGNGAGGFVNPAFEELLDSTKQVDSKDKANKSSPPTPSKKKETPEKPKREKVLRKKMEKTKEKESEKKEGDAVIKGRKEHKSSSSSSSSSPSSDDEETTSLVASSVITEEPEPSSLGASSSDVLNKARKKSQPSRGMKAALKVLNDSIGKPVRSGQQLTNAINIIQREWFKISSQKDADPHAVEDYMDAFEDYSKGLLQRVVNLSDINGNTAMHYAVSHGNFDVVSVLLDSKVCNINQQNKAGYTAIMLVALAQIRNDAHECVVRKLFESGDVNIKASQHGQTALMLAVSHGRLDMVRMLIVAGANPNIQDEDGSTALMCAAEHGHLAIVRYLVAQPDTDLYLMDNDGSTALTIAVEAGHKDVGVLLYKQMNLSRGTSPYSSVRGGKRPRTPTMARSSITPPPRSSAPSSPGRSRKSSGRVSPAHARQNSASLSNLII